MKSERPVDRGQITQDLEGHDEEFRIDSKRAGNHWQV